MDFGETAYKARVLSWRRNIKIKFKSTLELQNLSKMYVCSSGHG